MLKAVIFDLDDTLVHRKSSLLGYVRKLCADMPELAAHIPEAELAELVIDTDNGGYLRPTARHSLIRQEVSELVLKRLQGKLPLTRDTLEEHWMRFFPRSSVPMPGAEALLSELEMRGIRRAVLSNGSQRSREWTVESLSFGHLIERVYSSGLIGAKKPTPKTFEYVLEDMNLHPAETCFIGDHPVNDMLGAAKSGMQTIWLAGFHAWPGDADEPERKAHSMEEVTGLLGFGE